MCGLITISSSDVIVGVNKYKLEKQEQLEVRTIDNSKVLEIQVYTMYACLVT